MDGDLLQYSHRSNAPTGKSIKNPVHSYGAALLVVTAEFGEMSASPLPRNYAWSMITLFVKTHACETSKVTGMSQGI